jgi:hypothetical protein
MIKKIMKKGAISNSLELILLYFCYGAYPNSHPKSNFNSNFTCDFKQLFSIRMVSNGSLHWLLGDLRLEAGNPNRKP